MPIYAYQCSNCGHAEDVLQKMSDSPLSQCPACGQATYVKQVTAAGFQLKGSGWYVTDFRDNGKKPGGAGKSTDTKATGDAAKTSGAGATSGASGVDSKAASTSNNTTPATTTTSATSTTT